MPLLMHRIEYSLEVLKNDGCQLTDPLQLFIGLWAETMGDPCTTGCVYFNDGTCPAYLKHHSIEVSKRDKAASRSLKKPPDDGLIGGRWKGMTTKQIRAAENGISPNEFQKRKQAGRYKA